jgi:cob(I)alamin adenosyltransferase
MDNKFGSVEYFEEYMVKALTQGEEKGTHQDLYRVQFSLFDLVCEGAFSSSKKDQFEHLQNLRTASMKISDRLFSRWEEVL